MDEQRAWLRARRRKRLRLTAVLLIFCLLVTSYPDIMATLSVSATTQAEADTDIGGGTEENGNLNHTGSGSGTGGEETPDGGNEETPGGGNGAGGEETPDGGNEETPGGGNGAGGEENPDDKNEETPGGGSGAGGEENPDDKKEEVPGGEENPDDKKEEVPGGEEDPDDKKEEILGEEIGTDGTEIPEKEDPIEETDEAEEETLLSPEMIDIEELQTEEDWEAYFDSLDEETRAIVTPMEYENIQTYAAAPAEVRAVETEGFAERHRLRVVWINDPEHPVRNALKSSCAKSYVCLRIPDYGGSKVVKCYFDREKLQDKSGAESVIGEFTLPNAYADGDPFPTDLGMYSAISLAAGRPSGEIRLQLYDYMNDTYETYYSIELRSGGAMLGGILSKEEWLGEIGTASVFLGYGISEGNATLRLKASGEVKRRFSVSLADNYGVALPREGGRWYGQWSLRDDRGSFFPEKYQIRIGESDMSGVTLAAMPEAGRADVDGVSLYARIDVGHGSARTRGFSFPVSIDSGAVNCKVQYAGTDGSYIRTDQVTIGSAYTIKDLRDFPEVGASWKTLFDGSYTGTDGKTYEAGKSYTVDGSLGLFPDWKGNFVTLTLDGTVDQNGQSTLTGNGKQTIEVAAGEKYGETVSIPASAPSGFEFAGYYSKTKGEGKRYFDGNGKAVRACDLLEDTTLYAGWRAKSRRIVYRLDACLPSNLPAGFGGLAWDELEIRDCQTGDTLKKKGLRLPEEGKNEVWYRGYQLEGWYTAKTGGEKITNTTALPTEEDSYTFYAHWKPVACTMTYDANGGSFESGADKQVTVSYGEPYGTAVSAAPVPTRSGWKFAGYGLSRGTKEVLREEDVVFSRQDFTVYAIWAAGVTVNLDVNGGRLNGASPYVKGLGGQRVKLPVPTRTGYTFLCWSRGSEDKSAAVPGESAHTYQVPENTGSVITLKAEWQLNTYDVILNGNGTGVAGDMPRQTLTYNESKALPACAYTRPGYAFTGWNTRADGKGTAYADRAAIKNLTTENNVLIDLYAQWKAEQYVVSFDANGGTVTPDKQTVTYGSTYGSLPTPTRQKYTFQGWYTGKTDGEQVTAAAKVAKPQGHTLYAHWVYDYYMLSFDLRGGSDPNNKFHPVEKKKAGDTLPGDEPVLAGLTFAGWSRTPGSTVHYAKGAQITYAANSAVTTAGKDVLTLYAVWTTEDPAVFYEPNCDDGSVEPGSMPNSPQLMTEAEIAAKKVQLSDKTPVRAGYAFKGWAQTANDGKVVYQPGNTAATTASLTLYAVWEKEIGETVTLTLMDGATKLSAVQYPKNKAVTLPGRPAPAGKDFTGWSESSDGNVDHKKGASLTLTRDTTLYACYVNAQCKYRSSSSEEWKYGTLANADKALTGGGEVVMLQNLQKTDGYITLTGTYTLDLDGKTLSSISVTKGTLTICNGTVKAFRNASSSDSFDGICMPEGSTGNVTIRDIKIIAGNDARSCDGVYVSSGKMTIEGNTYISCTGRSTIGFRIYGGEVHIKYVEAENATDDYDVISVNGGALIIDDGFFYGVGDDDAFRVMGISRNATVTLNGGYFASRNGNLIDGNIIGSERSLSDYSMANKYLIFEYSKDGTTLKIGDKVNKEATVKGIANSEVRAKYITPANGKAWNAVDKTNTKSRDIWKVNGNNIQEMAPTNEDMISGRNTLLLLDSHAVAESTVRWNKNGSCVDVDLNGYRYEVSDRNSFLLAGTAANKSSIRNGILQAGGTATFQYTAINADLVVKANGIMPDTTDTIEAGARFYAQSTIANANLVFKDAAGNDIVLLKQTSDDEKYAYYYIATPWEASGKTGSTKNVIFYRNYSDSDTAQHGSSVTETLGGLWKIPTSNPTRTGFTFREWNTARDGSGNRVTATAAYDSKVTEVYAIWERNNYTVTFNLNAGGKSAAWTDGSSSVTRTIPYDYEVGNLPAARCTGYMLDGWYTTASGGTKITDTTKVTGNTTYYAHWKEAAGTAYTVKYQIESSAKLLGQKEFYGKTGAAITTTSLNQIKETFTGYEYKSMSSSSSTIKADGSTVVTLTYARKKNNVTVTTVEKTGSTEAVLTGVTVKVTGGGSSQTATTTGNTTTKQDCLYGETVTLQAGEKAGYEFVEWKGAQGGTDKNLSFTMSDELVSITAVYQKKTYPVAYDLANLEEKSASGSGTAPKNITHGGTLTVKLAAKTGYQIPGPADITVTVGGGSRPLAAAGTGDTCVQNADGTATLTIHDVTETVNIRAAGVPLTYSVQFDETPMAGQTAGLLSAQLSSGEELASGTALSDKLSHGGSCTVIFSAAAGYEPPENITVTIGGAAQSAGTGYHYDRESGTVFLADVTGNVVIQAGAVRSGNTPYRVEHYQMDEDGVYGAEPYETSYEAGTTGGVADTAALRKSYDGYAFEKSAWQTGDGEGTDNPVIAADGSTVIRFYYKRNTYAVTVSVQDAGGAWADWSGMDSAGVTNPYRYRQPVSIDLSNLPQKMGYDLAGWKAYRSGGASNPDSWEAYVNWTENPIGEEPDADYRGKNLRIAIRMPDSDLVVIPDYTPQRLEVSSDGLSHTAFVEEPQAWYGQAFETTIEADYGYHLPDAIEKITIGEGGTIVTLEAGDFTYDKDTGKVEITAVQKLTGTITVYAEGVREEQTQTVILGYADGVTDSTAHLQVSRETGTYTVTHNGRFALVLTPEKGYELPENLTIKTGVDASGNGGTEYTTDGVSSSDVKVFYDKETGALTLTAIKSNILISIPAAQPGAGETVTYTVEHYRASGNGYQLAATVYRNAVAGLKVTKEIRDGEQKNYTGYTYNADKRDADEPDEIAADGSTVLKLYYDLTEYTLTVTMEEGLSGGVSGQSELDGTAQTVSQAYSCHYGDSIELELTKTQAGKNFMGWHRSGERKTSGWRYLFTMPAEDVTVTAKADTGNYEMMAYGEHGTAQIAGGAPDADGGAYESGIAYETQKTVTITPEEHYSLPAKIKIIVDDGEREVTLTSPMSRAAEGDDSYTEIQDKKGEISLTVRGDTAVEFKMVPEKYELTLDPAGGSLEQTKKQIAYGEPYGELPVPTKSGYDFQGWYSAAEGGTKIETETVVAQTADHTLYAQWKEKPAKPDKPNNPDKPGNPGEDNPPGNDPDSGNGGSPSDKKPDSGNAGNPSDNKPDSGNGGSPSDKKPDSGNGGSPSNKKPGGGNGGSPSDKKPGGGNDGNSPGNNSDSGNDDNSLTDGTTPGGDKKSGGENADASAETDKKMPADTEGRRVERAEAAIGNGAVIVTVVCDEEILTAGVKDIAAVTKAVLTKEQMQLVQNGETIEIRIDVTDISDKAPQEEKEAAEKGIEGYRKEIPGLTLGMYVDISMFIRVGDGDWNSITRTDAPVEVVIEVPETLKADDRAFYILRVHDGDCALMHDMDDAPDTITVSTEFFSTYAIAYEETDGAADGKCSLCHICPTFLGICYFIWLAVIIALLLIIGFLIRRNRRKQEEEQEE